MDTFFDNPEIILILILFTSLPVVLYFDKKRKQKRLNKYKELGFRPVSQYKFNDWAKLNNFSILRYAKIFNRQHEFMVGVYQGHVIGLFLHMFSKMGDGRSGGKLQTAAIIELDTTIPSFTLRPELFRDKIKSGFGEPDINFNSDLAFSKKYFLQGKSNKEIKGLFKDSIRDYLSKNSGVWLESDCHKLLLFKDDERPLDGRKLVEICDRAIFVKNLFDKNVI